MCETFENCKHLDFLIPVHGDAQKKNLRNIKKKGKDAFVEGETLWYSPIKPEGKKENTK